MSPATRLAATLEGLPNLSRPELMELWTRVYGKAPPFKTSKQLLVRAIAYRLQEKEFGGLKPATRRFLERAAEDIAAGKDKISPPAVIKPGTKLLREWQGVTYEVIIMENGVLFQGRHYKSLSVVARTITGAHWSGPRFFGLKSKAL